jgi:hypothetical protein
MLTLDTAIVWIKPAYTSTAMINANSASDGTDKIGGIDDGVCISGLNAQFSTCCVISGAWIATLSFNVPTAHSTKSV